MNSEEVKELEIGSGTRAISLSLGKSWNVETFEEGTLTTWVRDVGQYHFAPSSSSFIIGLARLTVEVSTSSRMDATSITTSKFVATGIDFLTSGVHFFHFPPFLTESFAWTLGVEAIWPFRAGSKDSQRMTSEEGGLLRGKSKYHPHVGKWTRSQAFKIAFVNMQSSLSLSKYAAKKARVLDKAFLGNKTNLKYLKRTLFMACLKFTWSSEFLFLWILLSKENSRKNALTHKDMRMVSIYSEMDGMGSWPSRA
jgi:hypothetical protein